MKRLQQATLLWAVAAVCIATGYAEPRQAHASSTADCLATPYLKVCSRADGETINIGGLNRNIDKGTSGPVGKDPARAAHDYFNREYVPACTGNTRLDGDVLCTSAVSTCRQPGFIRFWVYEAKFDGVTNVLIGDWYRLIDPQTS